MGTCFLLPRSLKGLQAQSSVTRAQVESGIQLQGGELADYSSHGCRAKWEEAGAQMREDGLA